MTPSLAHEPRSREQTIATTDIVRDVLGTAVLGTYLYGSAAGGGLRSGSDLDILAVSNRSLTGDERSAIIGRLLPISGRGAGGGPTRPIELTIISRSALTRGAIPRASNSSTATGCAPSSTGANCRTGRVPTRTWRS